MTDKNFQNPNFQNPTVEAVVARLPKRPLITPTDIAAALDLTSTHQIYEILQEGHIPAIKIGNKVLIVRSEVVKWVNSLGYKG